MNCEAQIVEATATRFPYFLPLTEVENPANCRHLKPRPPRWLFPGRQMITDCKASKSDYNGHPEGFRSSPAAFAVGQVSRCGVHLHSQIQVRLAEPLGSAVKHLVAARREPSGELKRRLTGRLAPLRY